jgi:hypothetical protein
LQDRLDGSGAQAKHSTQSPETVSPPSDAGAVAGEKVKITYPELPDNLEAKSDEVENGAQKPENSRQDLSAKRDSSHLPDVWRPLQVGGFPSSPSVESGTAIQADIESKPEAETQEIVEPQPVEKPSADEVRKPVPHLRIVPSAEVRTDALPQVAATSGKPASPLIATSAFLTQKVRTEWRAEWRTISRNRRPLIKRLYIWECGKRRKATREDVESGLITGAEPLVQNLHTFTAAATAKIESEGKLDAVRNHAQRILDAANTKRARTA